MVLQTIGPAGEVTGEYIRNSVFVLDDAGQRVEQVVYHPKPTINEMRITREDIQDLAGSQLFGLETEKLNAADFAYDVSYVGEKIVNGQPAYLLAVSPKQEPNPQQMRMKALSSATTSEPCVAGRTAAPVGFWTWPSNSHVNVYLRQPDFSEAELSAVRVAVENLDVTALENGSRVRSVFMA